MDLSLFLCGYALKKIGQQKTTLVVLLISVTELDKQQYMRYQLYKEQQLKCDIETAWEFFSSPSNLSEITPKDMGFIVKTELGDKPIYEGMKITYTVSPLFKIPMKWKSIITQVDFQKSFTDVQEKGPYKYWNHFHEFRPNKKGVLVIDKVDYEMPFGFLGTIAHQIIVKKKLEAIFNYRNQILEETFNKTNQSK